MCLDDDRTPSASPRNGAESTRGRPTRLNKPAAAHAAGAIMNLQMNAQNRIAIEQVGDAASLLAPVQCHVVMTSYNIMYHCWPLSDLAHCMLYG